MKRQDIRGWFSQPNEDALAKLIREHEIKTVIEIGSFLGASAAFFAENCEHVYCIDPFHIWPDFVNDGQPRGNLEYNFLPEFWSNMKALGLQDKVTAISATSFEASTLLPVLEADLVYIDGAHDRQSVLEDITLWKGHARKILCGDDYGEHWPGVKEAVDEQFEVELLGDSLWVKTI